MRFPCGSTPSLPSARAALWRVRCPLADVPPLRAGLMCDEGCKGVHGPLGAAGGREVGAGLRGALSAVRRRVSRVFGDRVGPVAVGSCGGRSAGRSPGGGPCGVRRGHGPGPGRPGGRAGARGFCGGRGPAGRRGPCGARSPESGRPDIPSRGVSIPDRSPECHRRSGYPLWRGPVRTQDSPVRPNGRPVFATRPQHRGQTARNRATM